MEDVHIGEDGWLFLVGGANEVLRFYREPGRFSCEAWLQRLRERAEGCAARGASYRHLFAPDKLSVYAGLSGLALPLAHQAPAAALAACATEAPEVADVLVDLLPAFRREADQVQLYFRTDTHWTYDGAHLACVELCRSLGVQPDPELASVPRARGVHALDLGGKLDPVVTEELHVAQPLRNARRVYVNAMVALKEDLNLENEPGLHVGCEVRFENPAARDPRTVLLFGDSFSEYRPHLLTGLLAETFAGVHFAWSSSIDWALVDRLRPDIIVTETAERFAGVVPQDGLDLQAFVESRLAERRATVA